MELGSGAVEADGALPSNGEPTSPTASDSAIHNGDVKRKVTGRGWFYTALETFLRPVQYQYLSLYSNLRI